MYSSKSTLIPQMSTLQGNLKPLIKGFFAKTWMVQAVKFLGVGALNTLVDAGVYFSLTHWVSSLADHQTLVKTISYLAGMLNSFYWNKTWTFQSQANGLATILPFAFGNLLGAAINASAMYLCVHVFEFPEGLAFLLATGAALSWNFLVSRKVFEKQR